MNDQIKVAAYLTKLKVNFSFFLTELWRLLPGEPLPPPHRIQLDMAQFMQYGPKRRGIRGFRGLSKTWVACAYLSWRLYAWPGCKILLCSASIEHSMASLLMIRNWMDNVPFLKFLIPPQRKPWRDSGKQFDVAPCTVVRAPSVKAMGIRGQLPGTRANVIVPDDVETLENTITRDNRQRLWSRTEEFENIALPGGDILYLGTPHHEESVYDELTTPTRRYTFRTWPLQYPEASEPVPHLAPMLQDDMDKGDAEPGDFIWPERFGQEFKIEKGVSHTTFAMQFQLRSDLSRAEMYPLRLSDLIVYHCLRDEAPASIQWGMSDHDGSKAIENIPSVGFSDDQFYAPIRISKEWKRYHGIKAFIDPAGRGKDEMTWAIVGQLHGYLYLKYVGAVKGGATTENLEKIVLSLRDYGAQEVRIESNFGGDFLIALLEPIIRRHIVRMDGEDKDERFPGGWSCAITDEHSSGQKEIRIIGRIEHVASTHRLVVDPEVARTNRKLWYQWTRITRHRGCLEHDDRIEAVAGAISMFKDVLHQDADNIEERARKRKTQELLAKYAKQRQPKVIMWAQT